MSAPVIVLKFGGSVLRDETALPRVVHEVYRWRRAGVGVVAVVSAFAGSTDASLAQAARVAGRGAEPSSSSLASVLAVGEVTSAALLGLYLDRAGVPARVLHPAALDLAAQGDALQATPARVDAVRLAALVEQHGVVVVPGFVASDDEGAGVVLGRGGSDLTALFLAHALRARCRLVKDVDGLYEWAPPGGGANGAAFDQARAQCESRGESRGEAQDAGRVARPRRFATASWEDALATDGSIVQHRAVAFAQSRGSSFELGTCGREDVTTVGPLPTTFAAGGLPARPLRVALLGLGSVGAGVLAALGEQPETWRVVVAAARDVRPGRVPDGVELVGDPLAAVARDVDVVVEVLGGLEPARTAIAAALGFGRHVVTANKAVIAEHGDDLTRLAARAGVRLSWSAAVGGAVPVLEAVRRCARDREVLRVDAVLNGTANVVLDRLADGVAWDDAVAECQRRGFAEADPRRDLDGRDAADKLVLVLHALTGQWLPSAAIAAAGLAPGPGEGPGGDGGGGERGGPSEGGGVTRHVATLAPDAAGRWRGRVAPQHLAPDHPLAEARGVDNAVVLRCVGGDVVVTGHCAGRWPTTEAVLGDLAELTRPGSAPGALVPGRPRRAWAPVGAVG